LLPVASLFITFCFFKYSFIIVAVRTLQQNQQAVTQDSTERKASIYNQA